MGKGKIQNKKLAVSAALLFVLLILLLTKSAGNVSKEPGHGFFKQEPTKAPELPIELSNVWVLDGTTEELTMLYDGMVQTFPFAEPVSQEISGCIADVVVERGRITKLAVKRDTIEAKVLRLGTDYVELEGYGRIPLTEGSRVYKCYDTVEELTWGDVLVGYTNTSFVLEQDKICAALLEKEVEVTTIRVLLQTSSYGGCYHETIEIGSDVPFYLSDGSEQTDWIKETEKITVDRALVEKYGGRIYVGTEGEKGKLSLLNVRRAVGVPSYRGTLEITASEEGLLLVNELSLEEYLYGVLPSEMPESFGAEALKAQAVCARSYACNQLLANRYAAYGAHVDDSMTCQVYQNYGETESGTAAVKATFGKILSQEGKCITAYYFSCSYGHTSDSYDVWGDAAGTFLTGVPQASEERKAEPEDHFLEFLESDRTWYDADSVWFRWSTVLGEELNERILAKLKERQLAVPEQILIKAGETEEGMHFEQGSVEKFGALEDIVVVERGSSGIITKLLLVGSEASYLLLREYNIRYILAPLNTVYLQDGSTTSNMSLLPSAYFTVEKEKNYFTLQGGGYGHGVGMSQYGARFLASRGSEYEEILKHFYRDTELLYLYQ